MSSPKSNESRRRRSQLLHDQRGFVLAASLRALTKAVVASLPHDSTSAPGQPTHGPMFSSTAFRSAQGVTTTSDVVDADDRFAHDAAQRKRACNGGEEHGNRAQSCPSGGADPENADQTTPACSSAKRSPSVKARANDRPLGNGAVILCLSHPFVNRAPG